MVSTRARCGRCRGHIGAPKAPRKLFSLLKGEAYNFALFRLTLLGDHSAVSPFTPMSALSSSLAGRPHLLRPVIAPARFGCFSQRMLRQLPGNERFLVTG